MEPRRRKTDPLNRSAEPHYCIIKVLRLRVLYRSSQVDIILVILVYHYNRTRDVINFEIANSLITFIRPTYFYRETTTTILLLLLSSFILLQLMLDLMQFEIFRSLLIVST